MKKILVVVLVLAAALALTACGSSQEPAQKEAATHTFSDSIPIGDGVEDIDITGVCFGDTYTLVDPLIEADSGETYTDVKTYYCKDCDTPYIEVYSIDKGDMTLEEYTKLDAKTYGDGYYRMLDGFGYYTCSWEDESGFYYVACVTYEGEKQFHTVCYSSRTEELHIAGNVYMWIPTGYTKNTGNHEDLIPVIECSYDESYYLPNFEVCGDDGTYENMVAHYSYLGNINITKEQYDEWSQDSNDESTATFFDALGYEIVKSETVDTDAGPVFSLILSDQEKHQGIAYLPIGDINYRICLWCDGDTPFYPYLSVAISSIHTK